MGDLGVTFQRDGLLKFDQAKFEAALSKDYKAVSQTLTGKYDPAVGKTMGFMDLLDDTARNMTAPPNGILPSRKSGLTNNISQIDRQIQTSERMIARKEEVLKAKFARLEETISKIKGQGAGLAGFAQAPA